MWTNQGSVFQRAPASTNHRSVLSIIQGAEVQTGVKRKRGGRAGTELGEIYRPQADLANKFVASLALKDQVVVVEPVNLQKKQKIEQ